MATRRKRHPDERGRHQIHDVAYHVQERFSALATILATPQAVLLGYLVQAGESLLSLDDQTHYHLLLRRRFGAPEGMAPARRATLAGLDTLPSFEPPLGLGVEADELDLRTPARARLRAMSSAAARDRRATAARRVLEAEGGGKDPEPGPSAA